MLSMFSQRGAELKVVDGYKFKKSRKLQVGVKWRCSSDKCSASLVTSDEGKELLSSSLNHNHPPPKNLQREIISNSVKRKAAEDLSARPLELIRREISTNPYRELNNGDVRRLQDNIRHARKIVLPQLPNSKEDVQEAVESLPILSNQGENRLSLNDKEAMYEETEIQTDEVEDEDENEEPLAAPKPLKRAKTEDDSSNLMSSAFQLLQTASAMIAPPPDDDEVTAFFKYVITKVKTFSPETRRSIQNAVFEILMKADSGIYEKKDSTKSPSHHDSAS